MINKLSNIIKYNNMVYMIYYYTMNICLKVLKVFVRPDSTLLLFNSFAGRKYDDSPKVIYEAMKNDSRFIGCKFVWAFHNPEQFNINGATKIRTNSLKYFITALKAKVWITNSSVERGLRFKNNKTYYLNTWHGTPLKIMGSDIKKTNQSFKSRGESMFDAFLSQGEYESEVFSRVFGLQRDIVLNVGLPRNDVLANYTEEECLAIKSKMGINTGKKIILYCPTFREFNRDKHHGIVLVPPMNMRKWEKELANNFILLFRAHYEVTETMKIQDNEFVKDMTNYPNLNDLVIASDILISDYSSVFFDYSITGKPMLHFTYDYDEYSALRGMYFDIREKLNGGKTEEEIIYILQNMDETAERKRTELFREEFIDYYGNATIGALNQIDIAMHYKD